ncbi:MAG: TIGR03087 family PEP-CTERM/XrtA system glycosyltransferase [Nitrosospira sp.]|nr:TIGR03087 family PEP-CTERM/XrtA system glycosyltransferase [Nitrosospira sp.]
MQELLYLVHRIPYPPNKGDKIRSYHLLKYLSRHYRIHLGTFVDDQNDLKYLDTVRDFCGDTFFANLRPTAARLRSLYGLVSRGPLTLHYYQDKGLQDWVNDVLQRRPIKKVLVFSSAMAQYVRRAGGIRRIIDFVDIDSDKWMQYAATTKWPMNWIYRRESRLLLGYERQVAQEFDSATFVSEKEAELFKRLAPEAAAKVNYFNNGVDADYFSPQNLYPDPYPVGVDPVVFVGAMDYWANIDAVDWFVRTVLPVVRACLPKVRFYIVGARPTAAVLALASVEGVCVTGSVSDVRPYLAHSALAVAPLRIARGVQNKVLEAMAMEKIVVASPQAAEGICAIPGQELVVANDKITFASRVIATLQAGPELKREMCLAARVRVLESYSWEKNLKRLGSLLSRPQGIHAVNGLRSDPQRHFLPIGDDAA